MAITDTGTPSGIVGDAWLKCNSQLLTGPIRPSTTPYALKKDVPSSLGRFAMRIFTRTPDGRPSSWTSPKSTSYATTPFSSS